MAEQFYTILTKTGKAKIANASALAISVNFTKFQVGDSNGSYYNPIEEQTELKRKVWEGNIGSVAIDKDNSNWIVIETVIPADQGGFMIREAGIIDDQGNLIAIGKYPETYKPITSEGSSKDLIIRMILEVSNAASVTLKIDPTVILATKKDIDVLDNKIKNIQIPVKSVNAKTGDIVLKAEDIKVNDGSTLEQFKSDFNSHKADNSKQIPHLGTTTNSGDAYSIATTETINTNQKFTIKFNAPSTAAPTLKINSGTACAIKKANGNSAKLYASVYTLFWDGSAFILLGEGGEYGTALPNDVRSTKTIGTEENGVVQGTLDLSKLIPTNLRKGITVDNITGALDSLEGLIPIFFQNTQPTTNNVGAIWVKMASPPTGKIVLSFDTPPSSWNDGDFWLRTFIGSTSIDNLELNIIKDNAQLFTQKGTNPWQPFSSSNLNVKMPYPNNSLYRENGSWVSKESYYWNGGAWVQFSQGFNYLINSGVTIVPFRESYKNNADMNVAGFFPQTNYVAFRHKALGGSSSTYSVAAGPINLTGVNKAKISLLDINGSSVYFDICTNPDVSGTPTARLSIPTSSKNTTQQIDVSALNGNYYIRLMFSLSAGTGPFEAQIQNLWIEI